MANQTVVTGVSTSFSAYVTLLPGTTVAVAKLIDPATALPVAATFEWDTPNLDDTTYATSPDKTAAGVGNYSQRSFPGGSERRRGSNVTARVRVKADSGSGYELHVEEG